MVMLENESNSVGVHPSVPYSKIKAAHLKIEWRKFAIGYSQHSG